MGGLNSPWYQLPPRLPRPLDHPGPRSTHTKHTDHTASLSILYITVYLSQKDFTVTHAALTSACPLTLLTLLRLLLQCSLGAWISIADLWGYHGLPTYIVLLVCAQYHRRDKDWSACFKLQLKCHSSFV